jgi:hypothetical protein
MTGRLLAVSVAVLVLIESQAGAQELIPEPVPAKTSHSPCLFDDPLWPADSPPAAEAPADDLDPFRAGTWTLQFVSGVSFSPGWGPPQSPPNARLGFPGRPGTQFDYAPQTVRLGYILCDPLLDGTILRGVFEAVLEYNTAIVFRDYGSYWTGPAALLRCNWAQPDAHFIPYSQGGAGIIFTDAHRDITQRAIGQHQEFLLRADVGFHYLINPHLSLDAEFSYQHISNADLAPRNGGVNNIGGQIGLTCYFVGRKCCCH